MGISNQNTSFEMFTIGILQNISTKHDLYFSLYSKRFGLIHCIFGTCINYKMQHFSPGSHIIVFLKRHSATSTRSSFVMSDTVNVKSVKINKAQVRHTS